MDRNIRGYIVRFWIRMLKEGKSEADVKSLLDAKMITQDEYDSIINIQVA